MPCSRASSQLGIQYASLSLLRWDGFFTTRPPGQRMNNNNVRITPNSGFLGHEDPLEKGQATHSSILGLPLWLSW